MSIIITYHFLCVGTRDIVSIDPKENRLLYLSNEADLEQDTITFKKSLLKR